VPITNLWSPQLNNSLMYCNGGNWTQLTPTTNCPIGTTMNFQNGQYVCGMQGTTNINDTVILNQTQIDRINSWIGGRERRRWVLCYRRSRDGGLVATQHTKCNYRGTALLAVVRNLDPTVNQPIFGGYVEMCLSSQGVGFRAGAPAFLFQVYPAFYYFPNIWMEQSFAVSAAGWGWGNTASSDLTFADNYVYTFMPETSGYFACDSGSYTDSNCNYRFSGYVRGTQVNNYDLEIFYDNDY